MGFDFSLVDVFSDRPFGGNQLAVFPDAASIADETMQRLAREFNFSETTFVLPPSDPSCTCRVRIFTPRQELAFAGHPTLGTAAVLARSIDENIEFFAGVYGVSPEKFPARLDFVLKMAELEDKQDTLTRLLSGGCCQSRRSAVRRPSWRRRRY